MKYDAACQAIAEASTIDEVKDIRDKALALRLYAEQANNTELEERAAKIRLRAERRLGEMLIANKQAGKLRAGRPRENGSQNEPLERIRLEDFAIDKKLSAQSQRLAGMSDDLFEAIEAQVAGEIRNRNFRSAVSVEKKAYRDQRERDLGTKQKALPRKKFGVIIADPEWRFEPWSRETGMSRAPENHYPTSLLNVIQERDVRSIAAPHCILGLWATVPMLPEAFCVLDAWGFCSFVRDNETGFLLLDKSVCEYVSSAVWTKYKPGAGIGLGHWFRVDHEIFLIATRGKPVAPAKGSQLRSVMDIPASRVHSRKPELVLEMFERLYPNTPKIELNRRGPARPGWDAWGNETAQTIDGPLLSDLAPGQWAEKPADGDWAIRSK